MSAYSSYSDDQLVIRLKQDDETAFTELYNRYWEKLLIRTVTQLRSSQDAEELLHDIFVKIWNRRGSIELKYSFGTYIAAALKYEIIKKMAGKKNSRMRLAADSEQLDGTDDSTRQWLDFADLRQRLEQSVKALPDKCQLVFRLSREKGLSENEIAHTLDIAPKTVQNHMNRALGRLRTSLTSLLSFLL